MRGTVSVRRLEGVFVARLPRPRCWQMDDTIIIAYVVLKS